MYNRVASPTHFISEQEYNFRVKVNYQNGYVTVHGPPAKVIGSPKNQPIHYINPGSIRQSICLPQQHHGPIQTHFTNKMISPVPTFSESTQSRSQRHQRSPNTHPRIDYSPVSQQHRIYHNTITNQERLITKGDSPSTKLEQSSQSVNQEIHCVLCERNFKIHEFQYHLDLHRGRKKQQNILVSQSQIQASSPVQAPKRTINDLTFTNQSNFMRQINSQKSEKVESPFEQNIVNPALLYTFHHQNNSYQTNNPQNSSKQSSFPNPNYQHSRILSFQSNKQPSIHHSQMLSRVSSASQYSTPLNSVHSFKAGQKQNCSHSYQNQIKTLVKPSSIDNPLMHFIEHKNIPNYINQSSFEKNSNPQLVNQRIRYIVNQNIQNGPHQMTQGVKQVIQKRNLTQSVSVKSSQKSNFQGQTHMASRHEMNQNQMRSLNLNNSGSSLKVIQPERHSRVKNSEQQSINPFDLIQKQQSKIYDEFPESRGFSNFNEAYQYPKKQNQEKQFKTLTFEKNFIQKVRKINSINNNRNSINYDDEKSQTSISSIRSDKSPLENLNRQQLIKVYHSKRKPMDFTNIIGMSEMLAKGGYEEVRRTNQQIQYQMQKNKIIARPRISTAKSMVFGEYKKEESSEKANTEMEVTKLNLQMMGLQNKKVFRGTQVQQNDLRGSMMNLTRSSKSSAKTKLPKNYLAVPEFLHGSSRLA